MPPIYTYTNFGCFGRIIIFDGYEDEFSTKYREHSNRSTKGVMALDVHIHDVSIEVASQKNEFLRYTANKKQLIKLPQAGFEKCKLTYGKVRRMQTLS